MWSKKMTKMEVQEDERGHPNSYDLIVAQFPELCQFLHL